MRPEEHHRKGPFNVLLEFVEAEAREGLIAYSCTVRDLPKGRDHLTVKMVSEREIALLSDPYMARGDIRAELAAKMLLHLHKRESCS